MGRLSFKRYISYNINPQKPQIHFKSHWSKVSCRPSSKFQMVINPPPPAPEFFWGDRPPPPPPPSIFESLKIYSYIYI